MTTPTRRLLAALRPESAAEVEAVGAGHAAGVLASLVESALKRAFLRGAEVGRREIEEEEHGFVRRSQ